MNAYDAVGNFLKKTDYSQNSTSAYQYQSGSHQLSSVRLKSGTLKLFTYDNKGNQTGSSAGTASSSISYNVFNKPTSINQLGSYVNLFYDANWARYKQTSQTGFVTTTTYYVGNYEIIKKGSTTTTLSYLGDTAIYKEVNGAASIRFTHKDRLGSVATFSDHNGNAKGYRSYDPFGKPKTGTVDLYGLGARLANNINDTENITKRGFTGHEHLDEVELIHMNGRVYDYNVGRFMSVDPFIQEPGNSQSVNPYSYVMNNPLGYTDPSGYSRTARRQKEKEEEYNETIAKLNENINKANDKISGKSDNGSNNNQDHFDSFGTIESTDIGTNQSGNSYGDAIKQAGSDLLVSATDKAGELASDTWDGVSWRFNAVKDGVASDFEDGIWEGVVRFTGGRNSDDALADMRQNFLSTSIIAGPLKDLDKKAVSAAFTGELTKRNGGMTFGQWLKTGFKTAPHLQTRAATAGFVARTTAINAVVITTAYEGGNGFGSAIRVGINRGARKVSDWVNDKKYAK